MITALQFENLKSIDPNIKYGFTRELLKIGKESPEKLYKYFDKIATMIESENTIIKWTGIDLIGYMSSVDKRNKVDAYIPALKKFLHSGNLITCNKAVFSLGLIAKHKNKYRKKILDELLKIENDKFDTGECKNIAKGKVLETLLLFTEDISKNDSMIEFIIRETANTRNATSKKAFKLLDKIK